MTTDHEFRFTSRKTAKKRLSWTRKTNMSLRSNARLYTEKHKYGGTGFDESDSDSSEDKNSFMGLTPNTKRKVRDERQI